MNVRADIDEAGAQEGGAQEPTSLRGQLEAAFAASSAEGDGGGAPEAQAPAAPAQPAAAQPQQQAPQGQQPNSQPRSDNGQFQAKPAEQKKPPEPGVQQAGGEASDKAPIVPPPSWSAPAKAAFAALPPLVQQEVAKREADIERGMAQQQEKSARLNRLDQILGPRQARFAIAGTDEVRAVHTLFTVWDALERDPINTLAQLAQARGVNFQQLVQAGAMQQAQQPQLPPALQPLMQEVANLRSAMAQQQMQSQAASRQEADQSLAAFAADPANLYFDNVADVMATLLRTRQAATLQEAYDKATWADPQIRPLLLQQQQDQAAAAARAQQSAKAAAARAASGSVVGSPSPGAAPGAAGQPLSLRQQLEEAFRAQA